MSSSIVPNYEVFKKGDCVRLQSSRMLARIRKVLRYKRSGSRRAHCRYHIRLLSGYPSKPEWRWDGLGMVRAAEAEFDEAVQSLVKKCQALVPNRLFKTRNRLDEPIDERCAFRVVVGPYSLVLQNRRLPKLFPVTSSGKKVRPSLLKAMVSGLGHPCPPSGTCYVVGTLDGKTLWVVQIDHVEPSVSSLWVTEMEAAGRI